MQPLAERLRPQTLDDYIGKNIWWVKMLFAQNDESGNLSSFILWGLPGGKNHIGAYHCQSTQRPFYTLSAVNSGVKDVREVIEKAKSSKFFAS